MKITVISATNRKDSNSKKVAKIYCEVLKAKGANPNIFSLEELPKDFLNSVLYQAEKKHETFHPIQKLIDESEKFVFVIPEYNGSFPGVLKAFVDGLEFPNSFKNKKGALLGISAGTQGAAMAMSHFADVLNYLGMHTCAIRPRFININQHLKNGKLSNKIYQNLLEQQAESLIDF